MKSERRHELQTNELALWLRWRAPQLVEKYGTKILLGLVVVALAIVLIRYRLNAPTAAAEQATNNITLARQMVGELAFRDARMRTPGEAAQVEKLLTDAIERAEKYDNRPLLADAYLALGDYYWELANWPELPGAATEPSLRPELPQNELLTKADSAYAKSAATQQDIPHLWAAARLGQAAVATQLAFELDRKAKPAATQPANPHWAEAREHYEAVVKADNVPQVLRAVAERHMNQLTKLQEPIVLAPPSTQPASLPAGSPFLGPATAPATQPAK